MSRACHQFGCTEYLIPRESVQAYCDGAHGQDCRKTFHCEHIADLTGECLAEPLQQFRQKSQSSLYR